MNRINEMLCSSNKDDFKLALNILENKDMSLDEIYDYVKECLRGSVYIVISFQGHLHRVGKPYRGDIITSTRFSGKEYYVRDVTESGDILVDRITNNVSEEEYGVVYSGGPYVKVCSTRGEYDEN